MSFPFKEAHCVLNNSVLVLNLNLRLLGQTGYDMETLVMFSGSWTPIDIVQDITGLDMKEILSMDVEVQEIPGPPDVDAPDCPECWGNGDGCPTCGHEYYP